MKFMLNTDTVSETASQVSKVAQEVQSIMDECNSFPVDCEDGFDFAGAKSVIVSNLSNCASRMGNTASTISAVVSEHTGLQSSLTFEKYLNPPEKDDSTQNNDNNNYNGNYGGGSSSSGGSSGGGRRRRASDETYLESILTPVVEDKKETTMPEIKKVSYATVKNATLTDDSKKVLLNASTADGYIKIGNRHLIACDSTYGKPGDVIRYTGSDGKSFEYIVGVNTTSVQNKNSLFLLVENNKIAPLEQAGVITASGTKVENLGDYINIKDKMIFHTAATQAAKPVQNTIKSASTNTSTSTGNKGGSVNA